MDLIVKQASALSVEEKATLGITGIPEAWPIETYPYVDTVPDGFTLMTDVELDSIKANNQASYDAWLQSLRPIIQAPAPAPTQVEVVSQPSISISSQPAFRAKTLVVNGVTKNLYKRFVGAQFTLEQGVNTFTWTQASFPWCKFLGIEVIGGETGDVADLYVLDTATGTFSGVPNYTLNKFGYSANVAPGFYHHSSEYDADIYQGLQIKFVYTSISAKTIGINFDMNEVKS